MAVQRSCLKTLAEMVPAAAGLRRVGNCGETGNGSGTSGNNALARKRQVRVVTIATLNRVEAAEYFCSSALTVEQS